MRGRTEPINADCVLVRLCSHKKTGRWLKEVARSGKHFLMGDLSHIYIDEEEVSSEKKLKCLKGRDDDDHVLCKSGNQGCEA